MRITNIQSNTDNACKCGSWLGHWKEYSGQATKLCQVKGCFSTDLVGAHVRRSGNGSDQIWYVYPLCKKHHEQLGELDVSDAFKLVSANVRDTCDK